MLLGSAPDLVKFQVKFQFVGPPLALPCESPLIDQVRSAAKPDVTAAKLAESIGLAELPSMRTSEVERDGWMPPDQDLVFPAISAGPGSDWRTAGEGVFVGLLSGRALPGRGSGNRHARRAAVVRLPRLAHLV